MGKNKNQRQTYIFLSFLLAQSKETIRPESDIYIENCSLVEDRESEGAVGPPVFAVSD